MARSRTWFLLALLLLLGLAANTGPALRAQDAPPAATPAFARAVGFAVTPAVRDMPPAETFKPEDVDPANVKTGSPNKVIRFEVAGTEPTHDPVVQFEAPVALNTPAPLVSFEGIRSGDNVPFLGGRVLPPDTDGEVGPEHYVQMVNTAWRVWDKAGNPLTPIMSLGSIWNALGAANPCSNVNDGDPIVLYDQLADRWFLSQFCTIANPNNHQLVAISQTPDPTGAYYVYDFVMPNNKFNDYPKFGVWPDAYYMTDNQFNQAGTAFLGGGFFAFDRAKMLAGDPTAGYVYFDSCPTNTNCFVGGVLPSDMDGLTPPPPGTPNYFMMFTADEFGDPEGDGMRIWEFRANFATPASSTLTETTPIPVAPFDPRSPSGRNDIEQPPPSTSSTSLDSISDRLMHRLAYRNFGLYETLVASHTVNVSGVNPTAQGTHQAGVRYYQFNRALPSGGWLVNEQATFAPDTDNRWMGSAAMDAGGNIAVGYSVSSTTTFPSIRYAARLATDPPGGLFQGETTLIAGTGVQRSTSGRWGDYSAMSIDPLDDCTFWYTQQYYTAEGQAISTAEWQTRIGAFKLPSCTAGPVGSVQGTVTNAATAAPIAGASIVSSSGASTVTNAAGQYAVVAAPGTYTVTASKASYTSASATVIVVDGATTVQDFALEPTPVIESAGSTFVGGESCSPATSSIDPGETVTVAFAVKNTGSLDTTDLVGTLQVTGGVLSPSGPESYGIVVAGGPSVSREFTFTADSALACGETITATLQLQDGARDLGTVTYTLSTGAAGAPVASEYSSGSISAPIPDSGSVDIPIAVTDLGLVDDVNVGVRINHTFDGDLEIRLIHPDGTTIMLSDNRGGSGDNFGSGANDCSGTKTVFDDQAATAISAGTAPFTGSFRPDQALSGLHGKPTAGTWTLRVSDTAALDTGTVFCVTLYVNRSQILCCPFTGGAPAIAAVPPATLTAESCGAGNGAPDPDETVTMAFPLRNVGTGLTTDLVATLLPGGGVNAPSAPQSYGVLSPLGGPESREFSFVPSGTCGDDITATLQLQDGETDLGTVSFTIRLGGTETSVASFSNATAVTIPATGSGASTGAPATPYPSSIAVSGITGTVSKVRVTLTGYNHTFPNDVDVLLVGPGGQRLLLMSDVGGSTDAVNATLTFDDSAAPIGATVVSGTFQPTNSGTGDAFPAPAPAGPYPDPQRLSVFNGINPNGTWSLYIVDDLGGDIGSLTGGWSIEITTADPLCCLETCDLVCPAPITVNNDTDECSAVVTYNYSVSGSCGVVACVPPSGFEYPVGTTATTCTGTSTIDASTTDSCAFNVTVNDAQVPTISGASATPSELWAPNHKMVPVRIDYTVDDNCSATCSLSVASSEPVSGVGKGDKAPDWKIIDANNVQLRTERRGNGPGRTYTVTITCADPAGGRSSTPVRVFVPHDQGW
jgi:subtilisin-like proprotein convertase family protein